MNSNKMYEAKNYENLTPIINAIFIFEDMGLKILKSYLLHHQVCFLTKYNSFEFYFSKRKIALK